MICKTCDNSIRSDFSYCPVCGAKIIQNRLTLKNVWQDISFQLFNLDNTFLKTFRHLFTQPDQVIMSFISGARKKYMNPVSYFAIAITLSGLLFYVLRNWYHINLAESSFNQQNAPDMEFIFDYQGILSYLIMPLYALMTWILFIDIKKLNYAEHLVANAYITAQLSYVQVLISLPIFYFFDINYQSFNLILVLFFTAYQFYVFKNIHHIGIGSTLLRALGYLILFIVIMGMVGVAFVFIGFLTGTINLEDFAPPK